MPPVRGRRRGRFKANYGDDIVEDVQQLVQTAGEEARSVELTALLQFRRLNPPSFEGHIGPLAEDWLRQITKTLDTMHIVEDELRVSLASFQFTGGAQYWWDTVKPTTDTNGMEWGTFTKLFYDNFFPEVLRDAKRREFERLLQGDMSVRQYEARFTVLARFAQGLVSTEAWKAMMFERGLRPSIRSKLVTLGLFTYSELVKKAMMVEGLEDSCFIGEVTLSQRHDMGLPKSEEMLSRRNAFETSNASSDGESNMVMESHSDVVEQDVGGSMNVGGGAWLAHCKKLRRVKKWGPPTFMGIEEPLDADLWIVKLERTFDLLRCSNEEKVVFAVFMLRGDADYWWDATKKMLAGEDNKAITWQQFLEAFYKKYFPDNVVKRMEAEFVNLVQGNMTVAQYQTEFIKLSRFGRHIVSGEAQIASKFECGLRPSLQTRIEVFMDRTFAEVVNGAMLVETELEECREQHNQKKRARLESDQTSFRKTRACFGCGQVGHIVRDCPVQNDA